MKVRIVRNRQAGSQTLTATRGEELDYAHAQWLGMGHGNDSGKASEDTCVK